MPARPEVQAALAGETRREDRYSTTVGEHRFMSLCRCVRDGQVVGVGARVGSACREPARAAPLSRHAADAV